MIKNTFTLKSLKSKCLNGKLSVPADKSISIRALLLSSICFGNTKISNLLESEDVINALNTIKKLGINYKKVKNHYEINQMDNVVTYDLHRKHRLVENEKQFYEFLHKNSFDVDKVRLLTALIFLNIAPLHHYPYPKMLFYLGKESLYTIIGSEND